MLNNTDKFESGNYYHVYNRAVGWDILFPQIRNYIYFLNLLAKGPEALSHLIAYCLLPNHFHLLIQIKESTNPKAVSESFRRLGISFSQAINKQEGRKDSLFMKPIKRIRITSDNYMREVIQYIHLNPLYHGIDTDYVNFRWSSYRSIVNEKLNVVSNEVIMHYFGDINNFEFLHRRRGGFKDIQDITFE